MKRMAVLLAAWMALSAFTGIEALFAPGAESWPRWERHDPSSTATIDHSAWSRLLGDFVRPDPRGVDRVDYAGLKARRDRLGAYLDGLSQVAISAHGRAEQRAYWINLYNALTVATVVDHYPVGSIRDIDIASGLFSDGPWGKKLIEVEGEALSLDDIEHRILRPIWKDPRVHYALNCAAVGCPDLQAEAFTAENTERLFDAAARIYVNDPRGVRFDRVWLVVSKIYLWFEGDFGGEEGVLEHLRRYAAPALKARLDKATALDDYEYDWSLNGLR